MKFLVALLLASSVSTSTTGLWRRQAKGSTCKVDADCTSKLCVGQGNVLLDKVCGEANIKDSTGCFEDRQCQSGYCPDGSNGGFAFQCRPAIEKQKFPDNHFCNKDDECQSDYCPTISYQCRPASQRPPAGGVCTADNDCLPVNGNPQGCIQTIADASTKICQLLNQPLGGSCSVDLACRTGVCSPITHVCVPSTSNPGGSPNTNPGGNTSPGGNSNTPPGGGTPTPGLPQTVTMTAPGGSVVTVVTTPTTAPSRSAATTTSGSWMALIGVAVIWVGML